MQAAIRANQVWENSSFIRCAEGVPYVGAGVKEHHLCRFDEQRPHRRGRGEKLYRSFYMQ